MLATDLQTVLVAQVYTISNVHGDVAASALLPRATLFSPTRRCWHTFLSHVTQTWAPGQLQWHAKVKSNCCRVRVPVRHGTTEQPGVDRAQGHVHGAARVRDTHHHVKPVLQSRNQSLIHISVTIALACPCLLRHMSRTPAAASAS